MALVNPNLTHFNFNGEEGEYAKKYIDKLMPFMPDYGNFDIYEIIEKSDLTQDEKQKARQLYYDIRSMLTNQLYYAKDHHEFDDVILLTSAGRLAKKPSEMSDSKHLNQQLTINAKNVVLGDNHGNQSSFDLDLKQDTITSEAVKESSVKKILKYLGDNIFKIIVAVATALVLAWLGLK